jgi:hypothetical protein
MIFTKGAALQKDLASSVPDNHGEGPMQCTVSVGGHLAGRARLPVIGINQHNLFTVRPVFELHPSSP